MSSSRVSRDTQKDEWSEAEKRKLMEAIIHHGPCLKYVMKYFPDRSRKDVILNIKKIQQLLQEGLKLDSKESKLYSKVLTKSTYQGKKLQGIASWIKLLMKTERKSSSSASTSGVKNPVYQHSLSTALKFIALFQDHPKPEEAGGIDFKEMYLYLAEMTRSGLPITNFPARFLNISNFTPMKLDDFKVDELVAMRYKRKDRKGRGSIDCVKRYSNPNRKHLHPSALETATKLFESKTLNPFQIPVNALVYRKLTPVPPPLPKRTQKDYPVENNKHVYKHQLFE